MTRRGWTLLIAATLLVAAIAYQNRMERAALSLGPVAFYAAPLVILLLAAFLLGMAAMLLISLPADRRTRELLREHGLLNAAPPAPRPADDTASAPSSERGIHPSADHSANDCRSHSV